MLRLRNHRIQLAFRYYSAFSCKEAIGGTQRGIKRCPYREEPFGNLVCADFGESRIHSTFGVGHKIYPRTIK